MAWIDDAVGRRCRLRSRWDARADVGGELKCVATESVGHNRWLLSIVKCPVASTELEDLVPRTPIAYVWLLTRQNCVWPLQNPIFGSCLFLRPRYFGACVRVHAHTRLVVHVCLFVCAHTRVCMCRLCCLFEASRQARCGDSRRYANPPPIGRLHILAFVASLTCRCGTVSSFVKRRLDL